MVKVLFDNNISVDSNTERFIPTTEAQEKVSIDLSQKPENFYTLIMYDLDAPYPAPRNVNSPYIHYLVANIKKTVDDGDIILPYMAPSPPKDSPPHRYMVDIYDQKVEMSEPIKTRKLNLDNYVRQNGLTLADRAKFTVGTTVATAGSVPFKDNKLSEREEKFCSCVVKVAAKQLGACNTEKAWFEERDGKRCYNPYAVCASSVGTTSRECGQHYDFDKFSDDYLIAYAQLHKDLVIPDPYSRSAMLETIRQWKISKGKK